MRTLKFVSTKYIVKNAPEREVEHIFSGWMPSLYGLGSAGAAAIAHLLGKRATGGRAAEEVEAVNFTIMALMLAGVLALFPALFHLHLSWVGAALLLLLAAIDAVGNHFLFKTYRQSHASVAVPLLSLAPAFAFPVAWLSPLPHEDAGMAIALGYVATFLVMAVSVDWRNLRHFREVTFLPAILASLCFGLSAVPTRYLLREWDELNAPTLYMIRALLIAAMGYAVWGRRAMAHLPMAQIKMMSLRAVFVIGQYLLLYQALTLSSVGVALTLANVTPAIVLLASVAFLGEAWSWRRIAPAAMAIAAALLMT